MKLRKANAASDCGILAALHGAHFPRAWGADAFSSFFSRDGIIAYLAEAEEAQAPQAAGFIFCWAVAGECELLALAVDATCRQQGIARKLCQQAMQDASACGASEMHLEVAVGNAAAIALYRSLGFVPGHRRKGYYQHADGTREDALTMQKKL